MFTREQLQLLHDLFNDAGSVPEEVPSAPCEENPSPSTASTDRERGFSHTLLQAIATLI